MSTESPEPRRSIEVPESAPADWVESRQGEGVAALHPIARLPSEWAELLSTAGERPYRGKQIFGWIHRRGVTDATLMSDLSKRLRALLERQGLELPARVLDVQRSTSETRKLVLELAGGARVECVIIPMIKSEKLGIDADLAALDDPELEQATETEKKRVTVCISTQFGCAMGCVFCASGQQGLLRGLGAAEITAQVLLARRHLEPDEELRNLVFMGMGEPLHHYDETARAIRLLCHTDGLGLGPRRITVSTVGLVPGILRLGRDFAGKVGLAVSLHAPNDTVRNRIIPMNRRYPLKELMGALEAYPLPPRRRITIEYILIDGVNDGLEHARELAELLRPLRVKINLIPMNPIAQSALRAPEPIRVRRFQELLANAGYTCFTRTRRGDDVAAACGQLALQDGLYSLGRGARPVR